MNVHEIHWGQTKEELDQLAMMDDLDKVSEVNKLIDRELYHVALSVEDEIIGVDKEANILDKSSSEPSFVSKGEADAQQSPESNQIRLDLIDASA